MKIATLILFVATGLAVAQDSDRITVPFSNPSGAKTVRIDAMQGDITIRGHAGNEVIVEPGSKSSRPRRRSR